MNSYTIQKVVSGEIRWESIPKAEITNYAPNEKGYYPKAYAQVCHDGEAMHVKFHAEEPAILATLFNYNDPVSENSCVEFFFNAYPDFREDYMNFETNVLGTLLLGFGYIRPGRGRLWDIPPKTFGIVSTVKDPGQYSGKYWELTYSIPFSMINETYGTTGFGSGHHFRGNFFKVCSAGDSPHAGTWNPTPEFHDRFHFGELILE